MPIALPARQRPPLGVRPTGYDVPNIRVMTKQRRLAWRQIHQPGRCAGDQREIVSAGRDRIQGGGWRRPLQAASDKVQSKIRKRWRNGLFPLFLRH